MSRVYLADKDTLDNVNDKVGISSDTASSAPTTLFAGIKSLISTLADHAANWTAARAAKIDKLDNLGATGDTGGSATAGTMMAKLNALIGYVITNNTASKTGVLSAKLTYIINLLENATYGLSAIKTAISGAANYIVTYSTTTTFFTSTNISGTTPVNTGYFTAQYDGTYRLDISGTAVNNGTSNISLTVYLSRLIDGGESISIGNVSVGSLSAGSSGSFSKTAAIYLPRGARVRIQLTNNFSSSVAMTITSATLKGTKTEV